MTRHRIHSAEANQNEHEVFGECYLHRIIDGGTVEAHRAAGKEEVVFILT
jgi:hypothetical protein